MINYLSFLPLAGFLFCLGIFLTVILRRRWNLTALAFGLGMGSLALMEFCNFMALRVFDIEKILLLKRLALLWEMLFVGSWFLFSVAFAKKDPKAVIKIWRWALPVAYVLPGILLILLSTMKQTMTIESMQVIRVGTIAKYFNIVLLIIVIATFMKLENTFRSSSGIERWRIKYMIFGTGSILLFYVYILSQRLLYNVIDMNNIYLMSSAILIANILISYSVIRAKIVDGDLYLSRKVIYSSISLIAIGLYSVVVALSAQILKSFNIHKDLNLQVLLIFFAALGMVILFYKESFRRKVKSIINRDFRKSKYVYHDEWLAFSTELSKKISTKEICESFLTTLSERLFVKHSSLWLVDESQSKFYLIDSQNIEKPVFDITLQDKVIQILCMKNCPVRKIDILSDKKLLPLSKEISTLLELTNAEVLVPLILSQKWVGLLTLGRIQTGEAYSETEDFDLLKSVAAHAASAINNARLFEEKMLANEMEAFHRLSSFVMHDLKNTTSTLSMIIENAKKHMSNPEFQKDALRTISGVVSKMTKMIGNLSNLPDRLELHMKDCDLNVLINEVMGKSPKNGHGQVKVEAKLGRLPHIRADVEEIYKVVHNLLMNSYEALDGDGCVKLSTFENDKHVVFTVCDNGSGMSREFMENSLFQPFKSTKKKGLGIGLYQCKTIIEAHRGKIEVESEPGRGTTFSVYLPVGREAQSA